MPSSSPARKRCVSSGLAAGVFAFSFLMLVDGLEAQDLRARAILSWQDFEADQSTASDFNQIYDLDWIKSVSEPTRYHLWFRARDSKADFLSGETRSSSDFLQLQAGGELRISFQEFRLLAQYNDISTYIGSTESRDRDLERGRLLLGWMPESLPDLTVEAIRQDFFDRPRGDETSDTRDRATLFEDWGALQASLSFLDTEFDDLGSQSLRATQEIQGNVLYSDTYWDGLLSASGRLAINDTELDEQGTGAGTGTLREQIQVFTAASGIDETPSNGRDETLQPTPGLVDGFFVPIGISLGPNGQTFVNVALDFGRTAEVGEVRLYVRDITGDPLLVGGPIDWTVYASLDQLDWVPLTGVTQSFDSARSFYELTFGAVPTRFLKVVSFGLNVVETELVEVEAFELSTIAPGESRRTDRESVTGVASIGARFSERVRAYWNGRRTRFTRQVEGGAETRTDDDDHTLGLVVQPTTKTDVAVRYRYTSQDQTDGFSRTFEQWRADVSYYPRSGIDLTLQALRSEDDAANRLIETQGLALRSHANLLRTIDVRLDVGETENEVVLENETITRRFVTGYTIMRLTEGLQATATINRTENDVEEDLLPGQDPLSLPSETRWTIELFWRGGPPLGVTGRYGQVETNDLSTDTRTLNVQWTPFQGGNIYLNMIYDENVDSFSRRTFRRFSITPRWFVNRTTTLDADYSVFDFSGATESSQRTVRINLTFRL